MSENELLLKNILLRLEKIDDKLSSFKESAEEVHSGLEKRIYSTETKLKTIGAVFGGIGSLVIFAITQLGEYLWKAK